MKQAIWGLGLFIIVTFTIMIVMALSKKNIEYSKLVESVEVAAYQSLVEAIDHQEDPGTLFAINLEKIVGDDEVIITILESDYEKGILSISVEKNYINMGKSQSIQVKRTVIYEREGADSEELIG